MSGATDLRAGYWTSGDLPANVRVGPNTVITGDYITGTLTFKRFFSQVDPGLTIGAHCTMDGVLFNIGKEGRVVIGDYCYFKDAVLLSELELRIGNYVAIGWRATIADADFHPTAPTARLADVIALSPVGKGRGRQPFARRPVIIEDDVWIGPNATVLKGVRIGAGALVEPGAVVVKDVPAGARVLGNPAQVIGDA